MNIILKTNGFKCEVTQSRINEFNENVEKLFSDCKKVEHFYYGPVLVMSRVWLENGEYGDFNIMPDRVSFCGHKCSIDNYKNFVLLKS